MKKILSKKIIKIILLTCLMTVSANINVLAAVGTDNGHYNAVYYIATEIGVQAFATTHYYRFGETYTQGGNYIRYTKHTTASWHVGWTGSFFGDIQIYNPRSVDFYDSSDTYIKSANVIPDTDLIYDPRWIGYEAATGTDIATVNTSTSTAKANFVLFCPEALYGYSGHNGEIFCSN